MALDGFMILGGQLLTVDGIPLKPATTGSALKPPTVVIDSATGSGNEQTSIDVNCTISNVDPAGTGVRLHFTAKDSSTGASVGSFPNLNGPVTFTISPGVVASGDDIVVWAVTLGSAGAESPPSESASFAYSPSSVAPGISTPPLIGGTPTVGNTLSVTDQGVWFGTPAPSLSNQWQRNGVNIASAVNTTYLLVDLDAGTQVGVMVTAQNSAGTATASSNTLSIAAATAAPTNISLPTISGSPVVGQTLTGGTGTWTGTPAPSFATVWRRAGVDTANTGPTLVPQAGDVGVNFKFKVTAQNASGTVIAVSDAVNIASGSTLPVNTVLPQISGNNAVGSTLTTTNGTWTGTAPISYAYQWRRGGSNIGTATNATYVLASADAGLSVDVVVTASNAAGNASAGSNNSYQVPAGTTPPVNTVAPVVSGTPTRGQSLTTTDGTWTGSPAPTFAYQWQRETTNISGATGKGRLVNAGDVGHTLRCIVTAKNSSGEVSVATASSAVIADSDTAPTNTTPPTITGSPIQGQTLTANSGVWTGTPAPAITMKWQRDDGAGGAFADIAGEIASTYVLAAIDVGKQVRIFVNADNTSGSSRAGSTPVTVVASAVAPSNKTAPTFTGNNTVGSTLTMTSQGTWDGVPAPDLSQKWRRNNVDIAGSGQNTYVLTTDDVGKQISLFVTAQNSAGTATASSTSITVASSGSGPVNTVAPTISGGTTVGVVLTGTDGTWTGTPAPAITRNWQRAGVDISGATNTTYTTQAADAGKQIQLRVRGSNASGDVDAFSPTISIAGAAPATTARPTVSAPAAPRLVGSVMTGTDGTWTGTPTPNITRNWQREQVDISGATNLTYTTVAADAGGTIRLRVHGQNSAGSADDFSLLFGLASLSAPNNTDVPTISGGTAIGAVLTADSLGTWTGNPAPNLSRFWQRDNADISPAQQGTTYTTVSADAGTAIRLRVHAGNSQGNEDGFSTAISVAGSLPQNSSAPTISGVGRVGQTLTADDGTWTGTPTPAISRVWQRAGTNISGATNPTYKLVDADNGQNIRVRVTATNANGSASANSAVIAVEAFTIPANTSPPTISGTGTVGSVLSVDSNGTWTGNPAPAFARQWQRGGNDISGATQVDYTLVAADAGTNVRVEITATNSAGSATAVSAVKAVAASGLPANTVAPSTSGGTAVGQTRTGTIGTWTGSGNTYATKWQRNNGNIPGADSTTYTTVADDAGQNVRMRVIASNSAGDTTAYSPNVLIESGSSGDWAVVNLTTSNYRTAPNNNITKKTSYRMAPGVYRDFWWPSDVTKFEIEIIPQDRSDPPTIRSMNFGKPSKQKGNMTAYWSESAGSNFSKKITIDGLDFIAERFSTCSNLNLTNLMGDGSGIGWRVQGTSHPSASGRALTSGEGGNYTGLGITSVDGPMEVKNCLFDGYAAQIDINPNNGRPNIHHNTFQNAGEDIIKFNASCWVHHNEITAIRQAKASHVEATGGPDGRAHADFVQMQMTVNDVTVEYNFMNACRPKSGTNHLQHLNGGQLKNGPETGRSLRTCFRWNEFRMVGNTGILITNVMRDNGQGIVIDGQATGYDVIVEGNKLWSDGEDYVDSQDISIFPFYSDFDSEVAAGGTRIKFQNNRSDGGSPHGIGTNNDFSNKGGTNADYPDNWVHIARDKVGAGNNFSGRYGLTAGTPSG